MADKRVLLIVGGGIAAYKALELTRLLRRAGVAVRPILTKPGAEFVTPLSLSALAEDKVYSELFSLTDEAEMGHIELQPLGRPGGGGAGHGGPDGQGGARPGRRPGVDHACWPPTSRC